MDPATNLSFAVVVVLSAFGLLADKRRHSLNQVFFIFQVSFMGIIPWVQVSTGRLPWGVRITSDSIQFANFLTATFVSCYLLSYHLSRGRSWHISIRPLALRRGSCWSLLGISAAILLWIILQYGPDVLVYRDQWASVRTAFEDSSSAQLFSTFVRQFPFILLFAFLTYGDRSYRVEKILGTLLLLALAFPTAVLRSQLGAMFIAFLTLYLDRRHTRRSPHILMLLVGVIAIYPLMGIFRYASMGTTAASAEVYLQSFQGGDFDGFAMLVQAGHHVQTQGLSMGNQLLGALLFFVPRSLWPTKPIGSGQMLANTSNWEFSQVSCPAQAEAYLNFGVLGVVLFGLVYGTTLRRLDVSFQRDTSTLGAGLARFIYAPTLGLLFLNLRGDMMSSISFVALSVVLVVGIRIVALRPAMLSSHSSSEGTMKGDRIS